MTEKDSKREIFLRIRQIGTISTIPFVLAGGPFIGYMLSEWLEKSFQINSLVRALVLIFFAGAGIAEAVRLFQSVIKDQ